MSDQVPKEEQAGILGTLAGWGEAIYTYAADSVSGYADGYTHRMHCASPCAAGDVMLSKWYQHPHSLLSTEYKDLEVVDPDAKKDADGKQPNELDIVRRSGAPCVHPTPLAQRRQREFTSYKDYVGQDITCLLSVPVWIMEPTTLLQKTAEILEYYQLLNQADETDDEFER